MKKIKVKMNQPIYLGLSILEICKTLMYEFWYDYIILYSKYRCNPKLCYIDTDSFIVHIKQKMFIKTWQMMLKKDLIHQIIKFNAVPLRGYQYANMKKLSD